MYSSQEIEILPPAKDVQLPQSMAEQDARDAVVVIISESEILMDGQSLGRSRISKSQESSFRHEAASRTRSSGCSATSATVDRRTADREPRSDDHGRQGNPYQLLKRVMATSTAADYGQLSLAVLQKASEARLATVARN